MSARCALASAVKRWRAVVVDHRHEDGVVGGVRVAVVGRVVEEGVAAPRLRVELAAASG